MRLIALALVVFVLALLAGLYLFLPMTETASAAWLRWCKPRLAANAYGDMIYRTFGLMGPVAIGLTLGSVFLSALVVLRRVRKGRRPVFWRRVAANAIAASIVVFSLPVLVLWIVEMVYLHGSPYRTVFIQRCGACHDERRPLDFYQSEAGWRSTIHMMQEKHGALLEQGEEESVLAYLLRVRSISLPALAQGRCSRCHPAPRQVGVDAMREQVRRSIERLRSLDPRFLEAGEADAIAAYYALGKDAGTAYSGAQQDRFERYCEVCHFLDIAIEPLEMGDWRQTLLRMQAKVPGLISEEHVLELEPWITNEVKDPDRFLRRFPHSTVRDAWVHP